MSTDPLIGLSLDGRYRLDSVIGKGGMGTVYRATRLLIGDEVAIKILHIGEETDPQLSERFRREARAAARLKHPNAVSIYDFGVSSNGLQFLVMDIVEGRSLREITKDQGALSLPLTVEITSQVCAALDEAHRHHIVHRDIKPDNIILNSTPAGVTVKVLDFGIAKLRDDSASHLTQTGSVMGTPHYMSPEQCLGEELDHGADIYSMGIVIYEMLCGRVPFNSPFSTAVVVQHVNQAPPSLRNFNPTITPAVEAVVFRALEKAREKRPRTAGTLARELREVAGSAADRVVAYPDFGPVAPAQPQAELDEQTVEKQVPFPVQPPHSDLPPTVHLSKPITGGRSAAARTTNGTSSRAVTAKVKRGSAFNYRLLLPVAGVAIVSLIGYFLWSQKIAGDDENLPQPAPSLTQTSSLVDAPVSNNPTKALASQPHAGMIPIDGGRFLIGTNEGDPDAQPAHMVHVKGFYLDIYEVTCSEYQKFIDETNRRPPPSWKDGKFPKGTERHPVTGVSWEDAAAYARWAGKRLPTEEEWEFAARGPARLLYPWGNQWKNGCANVDVEGQARRGVTNVGSYNCSSPFGAQDLIGNAWEWTNSAWQPYPGGRLLNPTTGGEKVIRGGSWESRRDFINSTSRSGYKDIGDQTGFRCAMDAP